MTLAHQDLQRGAARAELAPDGILHAGINLANPLLVTGRDAFGQPEGIAPDMAKAVAEALGVACVLRGYPRPGETADAVAECGIVLIAIEAERAKTISFSPAYVEIEATYLARPDFDIAVPEEADRDGVKIVVSERSAYDLWLTRNIRNAKIVRIAGIDNAIEHFKAGGGDLLAGLRPALLKQSGIIAGSTLLEQSFSTVEQAVGTATAHLEARRFLESFVLQARNSGLVAKILERHDVQGLAVPRV